MHQRKGCLMCPRLCGMHGVLCEAWCSSKRACLSRQVSRSERHESCTLGSIKPILTHKGFSSVCPVGITRWAGLLDQHFCMLQCIGSDALQRPQCHIPDIRLMRMKSGVLQHGALWLYIPGQKALSIRSVPHIQCFGIALTFHMQDLRDR